MLKFYGRGRGRLSDPLAEEPPEDDYDDEDSEENGPEYDYDYEPEDIDYDSLAWDSLNDWEDSRGI